MGAPTSGLDRMENAVIRGEVSIDDPEIVLLSRGAIDIDADSFGGTISIIADPSLTATIIEPVRRSTHGHLRRDEGAAVLDSIDYEINLRRGDLDSETLEIRAWTSHPEAHFQGVDFRIRTPHLRSVKVKTKRGRVWVKGNTGPVDITTTYGDIRVVTDHPIHDAMTLLTKDGSIDLRAPAGSTGLFHCVAKGGGVFHRITAASITAASSTNGPAKFAARIGEGMNPVEMRTTNADIRVAIVDDPTDVGAVIFEP